MKWKHWIPSLALLLVILLGPLFMHHDPYAVDVRNAFLSPCMEYPFGTDNLGRCVLCRILEGGSDSVLAAVLITGISALAGMIPGVLAGWYGGIPDHIIQDVITVFQAFPSFVLAAAAAAMLGSGLMNGVIALSAVYWVTYAKLSRSMTIRRKSGNDVKAMWLNGAPASAIIRKVILPELLPMILLNAAMDLSSVILSLAGLGFLGLGTKRPGSEWGAVIGESKTYLMNAPWIILFNGAALLISAVIFNRLGETLNEERNKLK
jgi:peptide/nickel transport system permease protein